MTCQTPISPHLIRNRLLYDSWYELSFCTMNTNWNHIPFLESQENPSIASVF